MTINLSKEEYLNITTLNLSAGITANAIIDDDTLATATDSSLVTSEAVKAYSDTIKSTLSNNSTGWENTETTVNNNSADWLKNVVEDTTPQLGGNLDLNQKSLLLDPTPTANLDYNGYIINAQVGENVAIGDVLYLKAVDGKYWKSDADTEVMTKGQCVMATGTILADDSGNLLKYGYIRYDTWTWSADPVDLYVSCTPGNPTETAPSATGDFVRIIGQTQSPTIIFFNPDNTYIEVS